MTDQRPWRLRPWQLVRSGVIELSHRLEIQSRGFHCSERPMAIKGSVEGCVAEALRQTPGAPPELIYWDLDLSFGAAMAGELRLGHGGIDPLLLAGHDLSACLAVNEHALSTLVRGNAIASANDLGKAATLLLGSPATRSVYCPGVRGRADIAALGTGAYVAARGSTCESMSVAILSASPDDSVAAAMDAFGNQDINGRLELVVLVSGADAAANKQRAQAVDAWVVANPSIRVRRFLLWGEFDRAYLANTAVAVASGDVVIIADPACRPHTPTLVQTLADWAAAGDTATVSPRIEIGGRLMCAGLAMAGADESANVLVPFDDDILSDGVRLAAAPAPWMFASRRAVWIAAGGVPVSKGGLWTAPLAGESGPRGRHVMVGSQVAVWAGAPPAEIGEPAPAPSTVRRLSSAAVRAGGRRGWRPARTERATKVSREERSPSPMVPSANSLAAFSDETSGAGAEMRLLVFADAFGPSQSIAFVNGLATARRRGDVCVRVIPEAALMRAPAGLNGLVRGEVATFRPTAIVVSRMAEFAIWRAIQGVARARGLPIIFHIDDDLFDLPPILGIERYRLARHPRRLHTLHEILEESDLTLAATPALAARVDRIAGHGRVTSMVLGTAGAPPEKRAASVNRDRLVLGYMGSASHNHDLEMIAPALNRMLKEYPHVDVALFGSIARQPAAKLIRARLQTHPGVFGDYAAFRRQLAEVRFDIGLAPLRDIPFNRVKTPTKWVEYAEAGFPVIASDVEPYRPMAQAGALLAVREDQWEVGLRELIESPESRDRLIQASDALLRRDFGWDRFEAGMMAVLKRVHSVENAA